MVTQRLYEMSGQPSAEELAAENVRLKQRIVELEAAIAALLEENDRLREMATRSEAARQQAVEESQAAQRASKRQAAPFRRGKLMQNPKPPGRKPGHPPAHRPVPERPDRELDAKLAYAHCLECGGELVDHQTHVQYQAEIPEPRPVVTRFNIESARCANCGKRYQARHPEQTSDALGAAEVQIGPQALGVAAMMKHQLGIPYRKVARVLDRTLGLPVSAGALARADQRVAAKAEPTYHRLISTLRESPSVNTDDTGWWLAGENAWLWVFTNEGVTVYSIEHFRGHEVVERILSKEFQGVLISDALPTFDPLGYRKQKDLAHLLHRTSEMQEGRAPEKTLFPRRVAQLLRGAIILWKRRGELAPERFTRAVARLEKAVDRLLAAEQADEADARLLKLLRKHRGHLLTFLHVPGVAPTNTLAEREIRPAVVIRKISAGNRSEMGARAHAILASVLRTAERQGADPVDAVVGLLRNRAAEPLELVVVTQGSPTEPREPESSGAPPNGP